MNKIVATILLDQDDNYLCGDKLPCNRPKGDKQFLKAMVSDETVSKEGYSLLPPSLQNIVGDHTNAVEPYPITIPEISALTDILIVIRANSLCVITGKRFRFTNFVKLISSGDIEIWRRKNLC